MDLDLACSGDDQLLAGAGNDLMLGGSGSDTFYFDLGSGHDEVLDFSFDEGDQIVIAGLQQADVVVTYSGFDSIISFGNETILVHGESLTIADLSLLF